VVPGTVLQEGGKGVAKCWVEETPYGCKVKTHSLVFRNVCGKVNVDE